MQVVWKVQIQLAAGLQPSFQMQQCERCRSYLARSSYSGLARIVHGAFSSPSISHLLYPHPTPLLLHPSHSFLQRKEGYALMSQCGAVLCLIR